MPLWSASVASSGSPSRITFTWQPAFYLVSRTLQRIVPPVLPLQGTLKPYGNIQIALLFSCTCRPKHFSFCLTDSPTGDPSRKSRTNGLASGTSRTLPSSLDKEVLNYRANSFAASTFKTYSAQCSAFLQFCNELKISPVPLSQENLGRYIAFLSRRLCFNSVKQYLNIVRLMHLEAGLQNPLEKNWYVTSILKGVRRVKGDASVQQVFKNYLSPWIFWSEFFWLWICIVPLIEPSGQPVWWVSFPFSGNLIS